MFFVCLQEGNLATCSSSSNYELVHNCSWVRTAQTRFHPIELRYPENDSLQCR